MCDQHQHAKIETWITPQNSQHLSAKMMQMSKGDTIPEHTTGPGREEVITVIYGSIAVTMQGRRCDVVSGEAIFIPENTKHAVVANEDAQYVYCVTKRDVLPKWKFKFRPPTTVCRAIQ